MANEMEQRAKQWRRDNFNLRYKWANPNSGMDHETQECAAIAAFATELVRERDAQIARLLTLLRQYAMDWNQMDGRCKICFATSTFEPKTAIARIEHRPNCPLFEEPNAPKR